MVLSLGHLCVLQICNDLIDGVFQGDLQTVSPLIRRQIFATLTGREQLSNENCLKFMPDLLCDDSLCSIDVLPIPYRCYTLPDLVYTGFLQVLDKHFRSFPDVADRITTLRLAALNGERTRGQLEFASSQEDIELLTDHRRALQLINQCRNLKHLCLLTEHRDRVDAPSLLQLLADAVRHSGSSVLETLELIYYFSNGHDFIPTLDQKLAFGQLKRVRFESLRMTNCSYRNFLDCCHQTLERLELYNFSVETLDFIPIGLEQLTSLDVRNGCKLNFSSLIEHCPKIRSCHFELKQEDLSSETVSAIARLLPLLENCSISLEVALAACPILNELIKVAGNKVTALYVCFEDLTETQDDVHRLVVGCPNLHTVLAFDWPEQIYNPVLRMFLDMMLNNAERAKKLVILGLRACPLEQTLDLVFKNCINLELLRLIGDIARPTDEHLETWIKGGARPSRITFVSTRITDLGLKRLIATCGPSLTRLDIDCQLEDVNSVVEALVNCCPNLEDLNIPGVSERFKNVSSRFSRKLC